MTLNELFEGHKTLKDLGTYHYSYKGKVYGNLIRFNNTRDKTFLIVREIAPEDPYDRQIYKVILQGEYRR